MDGLSSSSYLSLGVKSPELDIDTLSVRSDESGDSSWQDSETGWTMVSDNMDIGEGLFRVSKDGIDRSVMMVMRWIYFYKPSSFQGSESS